MDDRFFDDPIPLDDRRAAEAALARQYQSQHGEAVSEDEAERWAENEYERLKEREEEENAE